MVGYRRRNSLLSRTILTRRLCVAGVRLGLAWTSPRHGCGPFARLYGLSDMSARVATAERERRGAAGHPMSPAMPRMFRYFLSEQAWLVAPPSGT